eukprot:scaffold33211_cov33-Tisochrysis_lutea.AAC.3
MNEFSHSLQARAAAHRSNARRRQQYFHRSAPELTTLTSFFCPSSMSSQVSQACRRQFWEKHASAIWHNSEIMALSVALERAASAASGG